MKAIFFEEFDRSYIPHILQELYIEKVYDNFFVNQKDLVIMDLGANIGLFSLFTYPYAKKIYAIEPSKSNFDIMTSMFKYNNMKNITPIQVAVSTVDGEETFHHNNNRTMFSLKNAVEDNTENSEKVITKRLDTLFKEYEIDHIDFLKMDIEGSEVDVIGGEGFEKVADKIDSMVIEWHDWSGRNPSQISTVLEDYGFEVFPIPAKAKLFGAIRKKL